MDSLKFNKVAAGILCAGLLIMAFSKIGNMLVNPVMLGKNAYPIEISEKLNKIDTVKQASVIRQFYQC